MVSLPGPMFGFAKFRPRVEGFLPVDIQAESMGAKVKILRLVKVSRFTLSEILPVYVQPAVDSGFQEVCLPD